MYIKFMLYCGLRTMEVAALIGRNIVLNRKVLSVSKTVKHDGTVGPPKTNQGFREVPIPDILLADLEVLPLHPFESVLTTVSGARYNPNAVQRMWRSFKSCMNIEMGRVG